MISSFYEESVSRVQSQADSIIVPSSTYCIAFGSDSRCPWSGRWLESVFNFRSLVAIRVLRVFSDETIRAANRDDFRKLTRARLSLLEIVSDEVLPVVSIINKKISPEEERITTLTLSSVGAELFLDGDTFIRIPELAHQVFTLTNRNLEINIVHEMLLLQALMMKQWILPTLQSKFSNLLELV